MTGKIMKLYVSWTDGSQRIFDTGFNSQPYGNVESIEFRSNQVSAMDCYLIYFINGKSLFIPASRCIALFENGEKF